MSLKEFSDVYEVVLVLLGFVAQCWWMDGWVDVTHHLLGRAVFAGGDGAAGLGGRGGAEEMPVTPSRCGAPAASRPCSVGSFGIISGAGSRTCHRCSQLCAGAQTPAVPRVPITPGQPVPGREPREGSSPGVPATGRGRDTRGLCSSRILRLGTPPGKELSPAAQLPSGTFSLAASPSPPHARALPAAAGTGTGGHRGGHAGQRQLLSGS